jgi:drug/metabolite transporter (DMT)-like permease
MWTLFTQALAKGTSTTQVSIMNTSTNFMITALLGFAIFAEALPPLWWVGASLLVAGNVVIGRKDERGADDTAGQSEEGDEEAAERGSVGVLDPEFKDDEDIPLLGDLDDPSDLHDR